MTDPLIGGRYQLAELLGRGGMAEVRKGQDTRLGRTVAVKRLRTDLASDAIFQARFRREAQSSAALNHPAIVAVYDTGEEITADGVHQPYIVMEYVAGRTLRDILREGRKILPERALEIGSDVLSALEYSHKAGIIHRDIKPGNVMLTPSGDVKVMDFGIARAISDSQQTMTQTAAVVGTAQYLSPEQARGETVDNRSDVYSAGCLLYELLTGRPPFVGDSPVAVAYQHVREQPQPPSAIDPTLPKALDAIVLTSLAKRVQDRYQSAAAMRDDIERYLAGRPVTAAVPPMVPEPARPAIEDTSTVAVVPAPREDQDGPRTGLLILLGALVIALVVAAIFLMPKLFEHAPKQAEVPNVVGMSENQARSAISDAGLSPQVDHVSSMTVKATFVISQVPTGGQGAYATPGSTVQIKVSTGAPNVTVPDVTGLSATVAENQLKGSPYNFTVTTKQVDSDNPAGTVVDTSLPAGQSVTSGPSTSIELRVSKGPKTVPDVTGKTQALATQVLEAAGFTVKVATDPNAQMSAGYVTDQSPKGIPEPKGTQVVIFVSAKQAPTPTASPTASGGASPLL